MQMEIDLTQLESDGVRVREAFGPDELGGPDASRLEPLRAELAAWVRPERGAVRATGDLAASIRAECDRCLGPVDLDVAGRFDQRYVWGAVDAGAEEHEIGAADLDVERLSGTTLDTRDLALEQIELAAPIRIVCSDACLGLCPECRANRNTTDCGCETAPVDPRWDALKNLKH